VGKARPVFSKASQANDKRPSAQEVRQSVKGDARRLLGSFLKKAEEQRGLPSQLAKTRVR
jgi:hypothetical protein